jgi:hypothetical protein
MNRPNRAWRHILLVGLILPVWVGAQSTEVTQALESARTAKAAGRTTEALDGVAAVLKKYPGSADASRFQIETLRSRSAR